MPIHEKSSADDPAKPATPRCPKCGCEISLQKYKGLIDLGVDGVRDVCPVCGAVLTISFDRMTAEEAS